MTTIVIILSLLLILSLVFFLTLPPLPPDTDTQIKATLVEELPELIKGKTAIVNNNGIKIWYNVMEPVGEVRATILLVMGHSSTALSFTPRIYDPMLEKGYRVIRYDNRGVGLSDWMLEPEKQAYNLEDMATDAIAILDQEGIEKAHVWGVSMGGMISQRLAINYPERFISLTSVMSSGYTHDPELITVDWNWQRQLGQLLLRYGFSKNEANAARFSLGVKGLLRGKAKYDIDTKEVIQRALYEKRKRRGHNPKVTNQHTKAIQNSGSRLGELPHIALPFLILHGTEDPLVLPEHGEKYSKASPQAKTVWIKGMAHDLPKEFMGEVLNLSFEHFAQAEKVIQKKVGMN